MKLKIKQKFATIIMFISALCLVALVPSQSIAQYQNPKDINYGLDNITRIEVSKTSNLHETVAMIINIILGFLGVIAVIIILYAGFQWMTAAGNDEQVKDAKKMIVEATIGLVIIFLSWAIANFIISRLAIATDVPGYLY
jgi:hypothetical protein